MKVYISIPITGHDLKEQRAKAAKFAEAIRSIGHDPVNPFDTPASPSDLNEREAYAYYMGEDIKALLLCDAAYFAKGWENSTGCRIEHAVAAEAGIADYYSLDKIPEAE